MFTILLSFANNRENPLPTLSQEDDALYNTLVPYSKQMDVRILRDSFITTEKLSNCLIKNREELWLVHYGGHANEHELDLEDIPAQATGIAALMAHCPNLVLVVLNGCATQGQVTDLLEAGVKVVIASSVSVGDKAATRFAETLYENLAKGETIQIAFELAKGATDVFRADIDWQRRMSFGRKKAGKNQPLWGIFYQDEMEAILDERLPGFSEQDPRIYLSHDSTDPIVNQLYKSLQNVGYSIIQDKMDLEYGGLISDFVAGMGESDLILVFISDRYIRSPYAMYELHEIARNCKWDKQLFSQKVLPIRLEGIQLGDPNALDPYFDFWEAEESRWKTFIQKRLGKVGKAQMDRYDKILQINQQLGQLLGWLSDIYAGSLDRLVIDDFQIVKDEIERRLRNDTESKKK